MNREKHRLLLDVDGVILDFNRWVADWAIAPLFGESAAITRSHEAYGIEERYGLSRPYAEAVWEVVSQLDAGTIPPYDDGSLEAVQQLLRDPRLDVYFVTAPMLGNQRWESSRRRWFTYQFGEEAARRLVFTPSKHVIAGDVFVDDKPGAASHWRRYNPDGIGIIWAQSWNEPELDVLRFNGWERLQGLLIGIQL